MSTHQSEINPGADAMANNLAGTAEEFNEAVTERLLEETAATKRRLRENEPPARETDQENPARPPTPAC